MSCDSAVYHAEKPYIIDFFHIIWYNSASIFPQVRKRILVMKLYLKDNKLILDASGRVSLKIVAYSAMIILYISVLSELLSNALENLFEIILYSVSVVALGLYLLLSRSLLLNG